MATFFEKNSKYILFAINILGIILFIFFTEIILRVFLPSQTATIGTKYSQNSSLYGWGYEPGAVTKISDPDTCEVWYNQANNHGWRDKDREFQNTKKAYRILVLGDSVTFGAIVPADKVYTRVLEKKLTNAGYNVEVINIAYGGWGTDQELEALKNEGRLYKPNLIIVEWCSNDLRDNIYWENEDLKALKPFYYTLEGDNNVAKHDNPFFHRDFSDFVWNLVDHSQILKRLKEFYLVYKQKYEPCEPNVTTYKVGAKQIEILQTVLDLSESSALLRFLKDNVGKKMTEEYLNLHLIMCDEQTKKIVMRILENRYFWDNWTQEDYELAEPDPNSYQWRLYFVLISKMKQIANELKADLAIFPETELGAYQWWASWYWIKNDEVSKKRFLDRIKLIEQFMNKINVKVIQNTTPYQRARNDFHPDIEGNKSMADDIFKFLMTNYKNQLQPYRKDTSSH
jgi:lysophospholipase L1-like esterase